MMRFITSGQVGGKGPTPHILFNSVPRTSVSTEESQVRGDKDLAQYCFVESLKKYKAFSEPMNGEKFVWLSKKAYSGEALKNLHRVLNELVARCAL
jgi:chromosome partitioning protein